MNVNKLVQTNKNIKMAPQDDGCDISLTYIMI